MIKDFIKIFLLTVGLLGIQQLIVLSGLPIAIAEEFYIILLFFFVQSIVLHLFFVWGDRTLEIDPPLMILAVTTVRLLTTLAAAAIFITMVAKDVPSFVITFFAVYLFYLIFEISMVLPNLRSNLK